MNRVDTCRCGGPIYADTDGHGHSIERCDRCGAIRLAPRALAINHPMHAEHERRVAEARALVESQRGDLRFCAQCSEKRVGHPNALYCFDCAQERRRAQDREAKRAAAERAAQRIFA